MKTKFFFTFLLLLAGSLLPLTGSLAYPNDAKTYNLDVDTGTSGTFITGSANDKTILYLSATCNGVKDNHILLNGAYILDTESNQHIDLEISLYWPASTNITWTKELNGDKCFFTIVYTDYNLASSTSAILNTPAGSVATNTPVMINNIENIGYTATSTISGGSTITNAVYTIPFFLFKWVAIVFFAVMCVLVISLIIFKNRK